MNGPASTVPAAIAALLALLQAQPLLARVQVVDEDPGDTIENEGMIVGDIADGQHGYVVMRAGKKPRDETYTLPVEVWTIRPGEGTRAARDRVFELLAVIEDVVATDPSLGNVVRTAGVGSFRLLAGSDANGNSAAVLHVDINVSARLAGSLPGGTP